MLNQLQSSPLGVFGLRSYEKRVPDQIVENIAVGTNAFETQRQELKVGCRGESARVLKAGHAA